ncbi:MAG: hypothetical protein AB8G18_04625 [Gammaproteobacteria bacterium]
MRTLTKLAVGVSLALASSAASAAIVDVDVTGVNSWDVQGDADNEILTIDLAAELGLASGTSVTISGVGWDVSLQAEGLSWLSEPTVSINGEIIISPGFGDDGPGDNLETAYSSGGILSLFDNGLDDVVLADGILVLEFFEGYDDIADTVDAVWTSGNLSFDATATQVPLPAALPLLATGLAGLFFGGARRRKAI